jgi:hypothetical protein
MRRQEEGSKKEITNYGFHFIGVNVMVYLYLFIVFNKSKGDHGEAGGKCRLGRGRGGATTRKSKKKPC